MYDFKSHPFVSKSRGILVDANLLTAWIVGALGDGEVEQFKRTREYTTDDVKLLHRLLMCFGWLSTTPHVLSETSNSIDWLNGRKRDAALCQPARYVKCVEEHNIESAAIVNSPVYYKLGITDAALFLTATRENLVLVTSDLPLYGHASGLGVESMNFNHLRSYGV